MEVRKNTFELDDGLTEKEREVVIQEFKDRGVRFVCPNEAETKSKEDSRERRQIDAIRVEPYYDTTCDVCGRSVSSDFERGMAPTKLMAKIWAWEEGFRCINKKVYCPDCLREKEESKSKKNRNQKM